MEELPRWLTRQTAADYLDVHVTTLDRWIRAGRLKKYKIEGLESTRLDRTEIDNLIVPADA